MGVKRRMFSLLLWATLLPWPTALIAEASTADDTPASESAAAHEDSMHADGHGEAESHTSHHGLPEEALPLQLDGFPERPKPIIELGEPFLGTGTLKRGFKLPTGAVWQPSLLAFGSLRSGLQSFDASSGGGRTTEWANRLDLFFNLQLSGSERLVVSFRTFDQGGRFSGYTFESPDPALDGQFQDEFDGEIESLFFEGDFGEIFPNLDRRDNKSFDYGFSVGRQHLLFQEGMLIQDTIDAVGITRNTLLPTNTSNFRLTFLYGWNEVNRGGADSSITSGPLSGGNPEDRAAQMFALLTSTDFVLSTVDFDIAWVDSDDQNAGDLLAAGISAVQRIGRFSTSFRLLGSHALENETAFSTDGYLLFSEVAWTPRTNHDHVYVTTFVAMDEFSSAARGPATGGPLGRAGINFAAVGLGSYGAALSSRARDVAGGAFGYQKFFDHSRKQLIVEAGVRVGLDDAGTAAETDAAALTARYQQAMGRRLVVVVDSFLGVRERFGAVGDDTLYGGRVELLLKF